MKSKLFILAAATLVASNLPAFSHGMMPSPTPAPTPNPAIKFVSTRIGDSLRAVSSGDRPDNPSDRINSQALGRAVDRLMSMQTSAGVGVSPAAKGVVPPSSTGLFSNPEFFTEYNFINSDDDRKFGSDTQTHSAMVGGDVMIAGKVLVGLIYNYSHSDASSGFLNSSTSSDANFVSAYAATTLWQFVNLGVSGGYGHTDYDNSLGSPFAHHSGASSDTWNVSPFVGVSYRSGPLSASLTTAYSYQTQDLSSSVGGASEDTSNVNVALSVGYAITERLKIQGSAKFTEIVGTLNATPDLPEARDWVTFGTKITYAITQPLSVYVGFKYDAFNRYLENETAIGGLNYSF